MVVVVYVFPDMHFIMVYALYVQLELNQVKIKLDAFVDLIRYLFQYLLAV
jgi:hypothetical protein